MSKADVLLEELRAVIEALRFRISELEGRLDEPHICLPNDYPPDQALHIEFRDQIGTLIKGHKYVRKITGGGKPQWSKLNY